MNAAYTPKLARYFESYEQFHQTPGNKKTHFVGIPLIMITLLGLLAKIRLGPINAGLALALAAFAWYFTLDRRMALFFLPVVLICYTIGMNVGHSWYLWAGFILGWVFQYVGHLRFEKKNPAFYQNVEHLLIGPLWIFSQLFGRK